MKRLLTYGLLLLTILASHFVVSACQDDLPETTEVMVTFTTRTFEREEGGTTDAIAPEKMKDLRVIVLDGDNIVIGNDIRTNIAQKSVVFSYATLVSDGETFKFLAIANEESAGLAEDLAAIKVGSTMTNDQINTWKTRTISNHLNPTADAPLPQSKFWTWTSQKDATDPNATLDYAASKISVQFKNETNAVQSLTGIKIAGIGSATKAYLFAQADNDFAATQNQPSDIEFEDVENLLPGTFSTIQNYYSNPLNNISSPKLTAKWNGEVRELSLVEDQNGNDIDLTSLGRNEYLQILVTLTGEGPKVTYTIHSWEENKTNIGDTAPTTPGNDYYVDNWGTGGIIDVGGGGNDDPWANLGGTTIVGGGDLFDNWSDVDGLKDNSRLPIPLDNEYLIVGYKFAILYKVHDPNVSLQCNLYFVTQWSSPQADGTYTYVLEGPFIYDNNGEYIASITFTETIIDKIKGQGGLFIQADPKNNIDILKMAILAPD